MSDDFAKQQLLNEVKMRAAKIREFVNSLEAAMNAGYRGSPEALAALEEMRHGLKMAVRDGAGEAGAHAQLRMSRVGRGLVGATNMTRVSPLSPRHDRDRQGGVATA